MAEIELTDDVIKAQLLSDEAHAEVQRLQQEYGRPTREGGWTAEQHAAWDAAAGVWRERASEAAAAITAHAAETGQPRHKVEEAVKSAARRPTPVEV